MSRAVEKKRLLLSTCIELTSRDAPKFVMIELSLFERRFNEVSKGARIKHSLEGIEAYLERCPTVLAKASEVP